MPHRLAPAAAAACLFLLLAAPLRGDQPATAPAPPAAAPVSPLLIHKTAQAPKIDGVLDDPCWQQAAVNDIRYIWNKTGVPSAEQHMTVRYAWDDHYLYIGYEAFDKNLQALGSGIMEGPKGNRREGLENWLEDREDLDLCEFFISFGSERYFWELHHNALNHFNDIWIEVFDPNSIIAKSAIFRFGINILFGAVLEDEGAAPDPIYRTALAVHLSPKADGSPSTVNDASDIDSGYSGELRLPLLGLGAPVSAQTWLKRPDPRAGEPPIKFPGPWKMNGVQVRILTVVQDRDTKEQYFHDSPTFKGGWFHKAQPDYPLYEFRDEAADVSAK